MSGWPKRSITNATPTRSGKFAGQILAKTPAGKSAVELLGAQQDGAPKTRRAGATFARYNMNMHIYNYTYTY
eukprot:10542204-Lingulodinium_polyedra.AAC.1